MQDEPRDPDDYSGPGSSDLRIGATCHDGRYPKKNRHRPKDAPKAKH